MLSGLKDATVNHGEQSHITDEQNSVDSVKVLSCLRFFCRKGSPMAVLFDCMILFQRF